jgi:hypothetical protein
VPCGPFFLTVLQLRSNRSSLALQRAGTFRSPAPRAAPIVVSVAVPPCVVARPIFRGYKAITTRRGREPRVSSSRKTHPVRLLLYVRRAKLRRTCPQGQDRYPDRVLRCGDHEPTVLWWLIWENKVDRLCYLYRVLVVTGDRSVTHTSVELVACLAHVPGPVILE